MSLAVTSLNTTASALIASDAVSSTAGCANSVPAFTSVSTLSVAPVSGLLCVGGTSALVIALLAGGGVGAVLAGSDVIAVLAGGGVGAVLAGGSVGAVRAGDAAGVYSGGGVTGVVGYVATSRPWLGAFLARDMCPRDDNKRCPGADPPMKQGGKPLITLP
jgi:hypothetical protein